MSDKDFVLSIYPKAECHRADMGELFSEDQRYFWVLLTDKPGRWCPTGPLWHKLADDKTEGGAWEKGAKYIKEHNITTQQKY